ncbi:MAG TPA: PLP-dependent aminotransferase family protein, partial [Ktedonobacterales bacterium]|nr:PLP-dependent aminotransferase family protein [Ktedonobacterales bacterium]
IESRVGDGARVAHVRPELLATSARLPVRDARAAHPADRPGAIHANAADQRAAATPAALDGYGTRHARTFSGGFPDVTRFPWMTWARLVARHAHRSLPGAALYQGAEGYLPLREAIAAHIAITRGVRCAAEDVIITAGSQGALHLIAQALLTPGDRVWLEDPGYPGARGAMLAAHASVTPVPVDRDGVDVAAGTHLCPAARLAAVTPSHQFPTGVTMTLERRLALLEWAGKAGAWIVEDDYDSEYRYGGRPLEALQGLDGAARVIYVGTFSKTLFPALRVGYLVAPAALRTRLLAARYFMDTHQPLLEQMALADFITNGHYARHIRAMRALYRERRDTLIAALASELGGALDVSAPQAGLHLVAWLRAPVDAGRITALDLGIELVSRYAHRPLSRDGLVLGFGNAAPDALRAGVTRLARALATTGE